MVPEVSQGLQALNDLLVRVQQAEASLAADEKAFSDAVGRMSFQLNVLTVVLGVATIIIGLIAVLAAIEGAKRSASDYLKKTGSSLIKARIEKAEQEMEARLRETLASFETKAAAKLEDVDNLAHELRGRKG